jgi:hypothetical protein
MAFVPGEARVVLVGHDDDQVLGVHEVLPRRRRY